MLLFSYYHYFVIVGTESDILEYRLYDNSNSGLNGYSIKTVHNWGEDPRGKWILEVKAHVSSCTLHFRICYSEEPNTKRYTGVINFSHMTSIEKVTI